MAAVFGKNTWYNLNQDSFNNIFRSSGSGAPTSGTSGTGFGIAGPGSTYIDYSTGNRYNNTGTKASPTWTVTIGYAAGVGGAVTQITSRTTGVTLNTVTGAITLVSAAGSAVAASFTVTNSTVAATDVVVVSQKSGTDLYDIFVTATAAGSFRITSFTTGGVTTEQPVFNFVVIKGAAS